MRKIVTFCAGRKDDDVSVFILGNWRDAMGNMGWESDATVGL